MITTREARDHRSRAALNVELLSIEGDFRRQHNAQQTYRPLVNQVPYRYLQV